jgi:transcription initiation factor IIF auxiliary subunit
MTKTEQDFQKELSNVSPNPYQLIQSENTSKFTSLVLDQHHEVPVDEVIALKRRELETINEHLANATAQLEKLKESFLQLPRTEQERLIALQKSQRTKFCSLKFRIGNTSQYVPPNHREEQDTYTHKWMLYVRNARNVTKEEVEGAKSISNKREVLLQDVVNKIRIVLDPSYKPNDVVDILSHPYHLSRRGWGEFPCHIKIFFRGDQSINAPISVIHHLRLDQHGTGKIVNTTETLVEVLLDRDALEKADTNNSAVAEDIDQLTADTLENNDTTIQTNNSQATENQTMGDQQAPPKKQKDNNNKKRVRNKQANEDKKKRVKNSYL